MSIHKYDGTVIILNNVATLNYFLNGSDGKFYLQINGIKIGSGHSWGEIIEVKDEITELLKKL